MKLSRCLTFGVALAACAAAFGHVTVAPVRAFTSATQTYTVRADGQLLTCEPASVLPMAQRYFLF